MSTLSVPLTPKLEELVDSLVRRGYAETKAEVVRRALKLLAEEEAIAVVLRSQQEIREGKILRGNIREILKQLD